MSFLRAGQQNLCEQSHGARVSCWASTGVTGALHERISGTTADRFTNARTLPF